ncbi:MAG TPA: hypothetical protein VGS27_02545 [Candidatus Sulfotelmatobacter sp.]|nr:hypothetical protein [Candidatus Sulfotelmatobacter sp.]
MINKTLKPYKFTFSTDEYQVHIYALKYMDEIKVLSRDELGKRGITISVRVVAFPGIPNLIQLGHFSA